MVSRAALAGGCKASFGWRRCGRHGVDAAVCGGPTGVGDAIDEFVFDWKNDETVGHRRWFFYPWFEGLGYGYFDAGRGGVYGYLTSSCVIAFDGPLTHHKRWPGVVAYPPPGAFPAAFSELKGASESLLWSVMWEGASFDNATVVITSAATGDPIALEEATGVIRYEDHGRPAGIGFRPARRPIIGDHWRVRIENVSIDGVRQRPLEYVVDMVDCGAKPIRTPP